MAHATRTLAGFYRDSLALMELSARAADLPGVVQAFAVMASAANLALLAESGLLVGGEPDADPSLLLMAVEAQSEQAAEQALDQTQAWLCASLPDADPSASLEDLPPRSIGMAFRRDPGARLALISTPGDFATAEALKALRLGLDVMVFSDNVSTDDELRLKHEAARLGQILMGPDCGSAILEGIPLGFANVVRRGSIGVVAASGTGLQEVTATMHRLGGGIAHAYGTGGRDLSTEIAGLSSLACIERLNQDPSVDVLVLVSKPPDRQVATRVLSAAAATGRPVVAVFIGASASDYAIPGVEMAVSLAGGAERAVALSRDRSNAFLVPSVDLSCMKAPGGEQRYLRGLFSGGTLCYEAQALLQPILGAIRSNVPLDPSEYLDDPWVSQGHTAVDLGDDQFTRGRPHPMLDHRLRSERIMLEAADPSTALIWLDVVLGYGAHPDPASVIVPVVEAASNAAASAGRRIVWLASLCATQDDPQGWTRQWEALAGAGMLVASSNAEAAGIVRRVLTDG